jgi:enoyl-CoA hydratase/carnithine racemase
MATATAEASQVVCYEKEWTGSQGRAIGWITLNRPGVLNAYNVRMRDELHEVLRAVHDDPDIAVLVLRGAGRAFCAGADLSEFGTAPSPVIARKVRFARDVWHMLDTVRCPVIASLHGYVIGSGLEMAMLCDLRIAADDTTMRLPDVRLGMIPAAMGCQTLPRTGGLGLALDLILTARELSARDAQAAGLLADVVPRAQLGQATRRLAESLAATSSLAQWQLKAVRRMTDGLSAAEARRVERHVWELSGRKEDEGYAALSEVLARFDAQWS